VIGSAAVVTSVRIEIGLEAFCFDTGRALLPAAGQRLRPREGVRLVRRLRARELRRLEGLVAAIRRRSYERDDELQAVIAELIVSERVHVRRIEAQLHRTGGRIPAPIARQAPAPVQNEIVETYSLMIELVDADENPVPNEPFRVQLPDGATETGTLDGAGKAYITGITRSGACKVCFYERDAGAWSKV
jgi:hypothetical protein